MKREPLGYPWLKLPILLSLLFDVCSLFTCVPFLETNDRCTNLLYCSYLWIPEIPENIFIKLIKFATVSVEFNFDNVMYRQINGDSIGSPLGSALANILVGFHEKGLLFCSKKLVIYFCYVNNTFCIFDSKTKVNLFFTSLNNIHQALRFTLDKETNFTLPFLVVLSLWYIVSQHLQVFISIAILFVPLNKN